MGLPVERIMEEVEEEMAEQLEEDLNVEIREDEVVRLTQSLHPNHHYCLLHSSTLIDFCFK